MEEERDFVVFTDDDGNDFELDVIDYFDYEGKEYAVLIDSSEECECGDDEECDCEASIYIMRIITNEEEDTEEFVSPAEEDMDALIEIVQARLEEDDCCGDDCDCCDEDCDCGTDDGNGDDGCGCRGKKQDCGCKE